HQGLGHAVNLFHAVRVAAPDRLVKYIITLFSVVDPAGPERQTEVLEEPSRGVPMLRSARRVAQSRSDAAQRRVTVRDLRLCRQLLRHRERLVSALPRPGGVTVTEQHFRLQA